MVENSAYCQVPLEEIERLKKFEWPHRVSSELIPWNLIGKSFLDVGAGPSSELGREVKQREGSYFALDINFELLGQQKVEEPERKLVQGNILNLPFVSGKFDVAHTRFVIMHCREDKRSKAIQELARIAHINYVLDYDWSTFSQPHELIGEFVTSQYKLAELLGIDLEMGRKLKLFVEAVLGKNYQISEKRFNEGLVNTHHELVKLAVVASKYWQKLEKKIEADHLLEISKQIEEKSKSSSLPSYLRPDIVTVSFQNV